MCVTIATTFTVAWLPYQLTLIVLAFGNMDHALLILDAVQALAHVNSCVNPIVYAFMWRPFRLSLIEVRLSVSAVRLRGVGKIFFYWRGQLFSYHPFRGH